MKLKAFLIAASLGILLCSSCNPDNLPMTAWSIRFQNDSSEKIWITTGCKNVNGKIYLTTDFPFEGDRNKIYILPKEKGFYTKTPYRDVVKDKNAMLAIFIISDEVYNTYSWEEIGEKELFLKKHEFRYGEVRSETPIIYPNDF